MDDKVYIPVVIPDAPFPTQPQQPQASTSPSSGGVYTHQQIPDTPMPTKIIAQELINNALNTKNRKILAEFQFTKMGAIQIGDFEEGQHGDVRISPDGIVARNVNGEVTFALDGDTGDGTFKGTVQAKDFVIADENGLVSLSNFSFTGAESAGLNEHFAGAEGAYSDITGSSFTITLERGANFIFSALLETYVYDIGLQGETVGGVAIVIDGNIIAKGFSDGGRTATQVFGNGGNVLEEMTIVGFAALSPGTHTIKLQAKRAQVISGNLEYVINGFRFYYLVLGA